MTVDSETYVYNALCAQCFHEKECHENVTTCARYDELLEALSVKLKPCPFCGSDELELALNGIGNWSVSCLGCGATGRDERKADKAVEVWNRRYEEGVTFCGDCRWWDNTGKCKLHRISTKMGDYCSGAWRKL